MVTGAVYTKYPRFVRCLDNTKTKTFVQIATLLDGIPNASFSEYQLIKSKFKQTRYKVKQIIDMKYVNNKRQFKIWWMNYKKAESTWEPEKTLREDGLGEMIDEYLNTH
jgi:hypothetical protein